MPESPQPSAQSIIFYRRAADPDVSVVVPTIPANGHDAVVDRLVTQQFDGKFEIVVVDDDTIDACEARNVGLKASNADIVALTDDDCLPASDWLSTVYELMADSEFCCIEGKLTGALNYSGTRGYLTSNLVVDRSEALAVGGFRSEYFRWREDTEFGWRMERDADGKCGFSEDLCVEHPTRPRATFIRENEARLRKEYPRRYKKVLNGSVTDALYRKLQRYRVIEKVNRIRYGDK